MVALKEDYLPDLPELLPVKRLIVETSKDSMAVLRSIRGDEKLKLIQRREDVKYADLKDLYWAILRLSKPVPIFCTVAIITLQLSSFIKVSIEKLSIQENIINQTEDVKMKADDSVELTNLLKLALESNLFGGC